MLTNIWVVIIRAIPNMLFFKHFVLLCTFFNYLYSMLIIDLVPQFTMLFSVSRNNALVYSGYQNVIAQPKKHIAMAGLP